MKRGADWLSWSLQFILGLFVGALIGFYYITRSRKMASSGLCMALDQVTPFLFGAALIGAGLTSFYGDQLWLSSYRIIPPDEAKHSTASRLASIGAGVLGFIILLAAIF